MSDSVYVDLSIVEAFVGQDNIGRIEIEEGQNMNGGERNHWKGLIRNANLKDQDCVLRAYDWKKLKELYDYLNDNNRPDASVERALAFAESKFAKSSNDAETEWEKARKEDDRLRRITHERMSPEEVEAGRGPGA